MLDIGTGNGALARLLQEEGRDMTTVDAIDKSLFPKCTHRDRWPRPALRGRASAACC